MRIPALPRRALDARQAELYDAIAGGRRASGPQHFPLVDADGALRGPFNALLLAPAVGTAVQALGSALRFDSALSDRARELAILLVAAHWRSDFERESHEAVGRAIGLTESELVALRAGEVAAFEGVERTIAETVLALLGGDLADDEWRAADGAIGAAGILELSTLVGYYSLLALQLRIFRV